MMIIKKILVYSLMLSSLLGCKEINNEKIAQSPVVSLPKVENPTTVKFDKQEHDFWTIQQDEVVETEFIVTNTGDKSLFITNAFGSCGCTVPKVTKETIKPGANAPIHVKFDSNGKLGMVQKTNTIRCNTKKLNEKVKIKANILTTKK